MGFDFGAFAGGLMDGADKGMRVGRNIRDIIRENKMHETLASAREEAAAAYDAGQNKAANSVSEVPSTAGQPYQSESGAVVSPIKPTAIVASGLPPLAQDAETSAPEAPSSTSTPPSVSTQTPSTDIAQPSPQQQVTAGGVTPAQAAQAQPDPSAAPQAPVQPGKYEAGGKSFDTRQQAEANAGVKNDPTARSMYIQKHMAQKAQDYFMSIGDMDMAEKYGKQAETVAGKQAIKDWADAKSATDIDTRAKNFGKYYTDHVNDGVDYAGHKVLTKEDGTQVAVVSLKDKRTGKTSEMELTDEKMLQLGDAWNPAAVFKSEQAKAAAVAAQKAKIGEKTAEAALKLREEAYKADRLDKREGIKAEIAQTLEAKKGQQKLSEISLKGQIDAQNVGAKAKAELTAKTDALRDAGYTDDEIKPLVPMLLKAGEFKKETSPQERRAIIGTELMKTDPTFSRASAEDQRARIDKAMAAISADAPSSGSAPSAPSAPGAKPTAPAAGAEQQFRDPKRPGRLFIQKDGAYVDIGPDPKYKGPPVAPSPASTVATGMPPQVAPAQPAKDPSTLDRIDSKAMDAAKVLADQLKQAEAMTNAAAKSGDVKSVMGYNDRQQAIRKQLIDQVNKQFGNNAPNVLKQLGVQ